MSASHVSGCAPAPVPPEARSAFKATNAALSSADGDGNVHDASVTLAALEIALCALARAEQPSSAKLAVRGASAAENAPLESVVAVATTPLIPPPGTKAKPVPKV